MRECTLWRAAAFARTQHFQKGRWRRITRVLLNDNSDSKQLGKSVEYFSLSCPSAQSV